ncbi:hypothetical protein HMPREF9347_01056 [Escherichia coli MS 124-1]|nr:hypothetical protein HMPREF9347_01056 [Escherichia coli MS 124-1]
MCNFVERLSGGNFAFPEARSEEFNERVKTAQNSARQLPVPD